jgi:hypothetical protein
MMPSQRTSDPAVKQSHYTSSGAAAVPFQDRNLAKYDVSRPNNLAISGEEFPYQGANVRDESKRVAFVFPVSVASQNSKAPPYLAHAQYC